MEKRLLITGFDAFGGKPLNPSWLAVEALPDRIGDFWLHKKIIPTCFGEAARQVLAEGTLYVGEDDGFLWGVVNLNGIQLPEYDDIPWEIAAEREQVGVIHTMCIHPAASGRGRARRMVTFCEEESRRLGKTVIRLDTWEGNVPANAMYPKLGYTFAGATEFFFQGFIHEILNCYEKKL